MNTRIPDAHDVLRLFGDMSDHTLSQILETGATVEQLEAVAGWLAQEDDDSDSIRVPFDGPCAQVLMLLEQDPDQNPEPEY
jgi:hypothetical protein